MDDLVANLISFVFHLLFVPAGIFMAIAGIFVFGIVVISVVNLKFDKWSQSNASQSTITSR